MSDVIDDVPHLAGVWTEDYEDKVIDLFFVFVVLIHNHSENKIHQKEKRNRHEGNKIQRHPAIPVIRWHHNVRIVDLYNSAKVSKYFRKRLAL